MVVGGDARQSGKLVYALVDSRKIIVHESNKYCIISEGLESSKYQIIFF